MLLPALLPALLVSAGLAFSPEPTKPIALIREGALQGLAARSAAGNVFYSFKGIPYARAPTGELRFKPPRRHPGWQGVADAAQHGSSCLQYNLFKNSEKEGAEDCLFVNVYSPVVPRQTTPPGGLPVMVMVHGGAFTMGSGDEDDYGPHYFMDEGIVLVTFNYRLGPFGFFSTYDTSASGNYGLLDQVLVLEWVRDNIASFGGDPQSVTIFGESAGGACVSLLVLSPLTRGLFHHAISQSGSALGGWAASGRRTGAMRGLTSKLNCSSGGDAGTADTGTVVQCMRNASADDLIDSFKELGLDNLLLLPRVDKESQKPFLPEDPRFILASGTFNLVPWMNGVMEEESAFFLPDFLKSPELTASIQESSPQAVGLLADITTPAETNILDCGANATAVSAELLRFYAGNGSLADNNFLPLLHLLSDRSFNVPMSEEVRLASFHTAVYKYVLDHKGPGRLSTPALLGGDTSYAPSHVDDLLYLFSGSELPFPAAKSPEYRMIRFMVSLWTSFARTGRPSSDVFPMPDWPVFQERSQRHMRLNSEPSVAERLFCKRIEFWRSLPFNEPWRHEVETGGC